MDKLDLNDFLEWLDDYPAVNLSTSNTSWNGCLASYIKDLYSTNDVSVTLSYAEIDGRWINLPRWSTMVVRYELSHAFLYTKEGIKKAALNER